MGELHPATIPIVVAFLIAFPSIIVVTVLILRFLHKKKELEMRGSDSVDALRDDLDDTRAQLADMQERLDFAERVLAAGRASQEDRSG